MPILAFSSIFQKNNTLCGKSAPTNIRIAEILAFQSPFDLRWPCHFTVEAVTFTYYKYSTILALCCLKNKPKQVSYTMRPFLCWWCQFLINFTSIRLCIGIESEIHLYSALTYKLRIFQKFQSLVF